jgi:putative inorganic carbon (HCO3(-)) transporter
MRTASFLRTTNLTTAGLVLLTIVISLAAGVSVLTFQSPLSPLIMAGTILAAVLAVVFLLNPVQALCAAIVVALLPRQILLLFPIPVIRDYSIVLGLLFACVSWLLSVAIRRRKIVWTSTNLVMLVFLAWSIITLFWATDLVPVRRQLMAYIVGFAPLLLLVNEIDSPQTLNRLMATLALSGWVLVLAGVGTILTEGYTPGTRLKALGMNENEMGILALVTMIGVLWQDMQPSPRHKRLKVLLSWAFLLMTIALVAASGSRGSAISLLVTLLAFCFWKPTRAWGVLGLLVMALGVILAPLLFSTTLERFAIPRGDTLLGGREALWQATWNLILDHPWLGVGIGNARHAVRPYVLLLRSVGGSESVAAHNPVLQVWAETGLPGILLYLGILGSAVWLFVRQYLLCRRFGMQVLVPYFALVSSAFLGYMASWIKGGGMESDFTYFLMLALLLIPACLDLEGRGDTTELK